MSHDGTESPEARPFYSPNGIARILARSAAKASPAPPVGAVWAVPSGSALFGRHFASSPLMAWDCFSRRFTISSNTFFMTPPFRSLEFPLFGKGVKPPLERSQPGGLSADKVHDGSPGRRTMMV
jgi:hypothetical protein